MRKTLGKHVARYAGRPPGPRAERYAWAGCAVLAPVFALASDVGPHRVWGLGAGAGYALAACLASGSGRRRAAARAVAVAGAVVVPLVALPAAGLGQSEVGVVERSGHLLLTTGSPYVTDPVAVGDFNPYLPGMALFGLLPGDPRWWLGGAFVAALAATGLHRAWLLACPPVALPLAVGGVDLPVAGLMCLGVALAGRRRPGRAGLALGAAAALKWTAWPALPVALALVAARGSGWPALRCAAAGLATATAAVLPFALTDPAGFVRNVVAFPLGLTSVVSPAASPLPGHLLAAHVPGGTLIALTLLVAGALLITLSLVVRPPGTVREAADRLALGLGLATALMPATRFGYVVYPLVLGALACRGRPPGTPATRSAAKAAVA
ncbi:glycosyltransferase 87 family protein [Streptomyces sp. M92]|uniref:glycosyltransferase 87 family protein n=1 Tax=Streptomyces sp. M92 TaxID=2944250 RepID=UPI00234BCE18|nr:glycosyltransferase 87 family protein [Streptomyces sp. M92]WCN03550.1 glycosyltransferase 87 family protein [Streptomyces sp. M92]